MKKIVFVLIVLFLLPTSGASLKTGTVNMIYPELNKIRFRLSGESSGCLASDQYFIITLDENSLSIKNHTTSFYYFPIIMYSRKAPKALTIDIINDDKCCGINLDCDPNIKEIPVNYMYMDF